MFVGKLEFLKEEWIMDDFKTKLLYEHFKDICKEYETEPTEAIQLLTEQILEEHRQNIKVLESVRNSFTIKELKETPREKAIEDIKKKALEIYREEGRLPGRPRLVQLLKYRERHARLALEEIREELNTP